MVVFWENANLASKEVPTDPAIFFPAPLWCSHYVEVSVEKTELLMAEGRSDVPDTFKWSHYPLLVFRP